MATIKLINISTPCSQVGMSGECVISSVLSHPVKISNSRPVLQLSHGSVLFGKQRIIHPQCVRAGGPQRRVVNPSWLPLFIHFVSSPSSLPSANWASQQGYLLHLWFSLWSLDIPLFYFHEIFPLSFSHYHSGLLFPILTDRYWLRGTSFSYTK